MGVGSLLSDILMTNLFGFLMIFTRTGTAMMIMPTIGESFIPAQIRLLFALSLSFIMTPILIHHLPPMPSNSVAMFLLLISEMLVGVFIGTIMRVLLNALDTAGMAIASQSGFANAQVFNPVIGGQGSLPGTLLILLAVVLIFATNMHHLLLSAVFNSYEIFPADGQFLDVGSMAELLSKIVNLAFNLGVRIALPFFVLGLILYLGFGLLGRLMPQLQVFFLALPLQILLSLLMMSLTLSAIMLFWLSNYEEAIISFLRQS